MSKIACLFWLGEVEQHLFLEESADGGRKDEARG